MGADQIRSSQCRIEHPGASDADIQACKKEKKDKAEGVIWMGDTLPATSSFQKGTPTSWLGTVIKAIPSPEVKKPAPPPAKDAVISPQAMEQVMSASVQAKQQIEAQVIVGSHLGK